MLYSVEGCFNFSFNYIILHFPRDIRNESWDKIILKISIVTLVYNCDYMYQRFITIFSPFMSRDEGVLTIAVESA